MKTLSHWQWLILSKNLSSKREKAPVPLLEFFPRQPKPAFYFNLRIWLSCANNGTHAIVKAKSTGAQSPLGYNTSPVLPIRSFRSYRSRRSLDHSFLASGLLRFGEEISGSSFSLLIFKNLLATAHPLWLLEVFFFHNRLAQLFRLSRSRRKLLISSPAHPWYGGAKIIVSAICSRDPFLLTQWAKKRMGRMRLFAHKKFLRLLGSFLRSYVSLKTSKTRVLGFNLVTTGKISVTGNAMSRTMLTRFGKAGINNLSYRASSSFALIKTKTGCLGLNLVFYY